MCEEFRDMNEPRAESPGGEPIRPDLKPIESALAILVPQPARLDRDRLLYEAGRLAGRSGRSNRRRFVWPAIAAALAAMLVVSLVARPEPRIVERIVRVPVEAPSPVARAESDVPPGPAVAVAVVRQHEPQAALTGDGLARRNAILPASRPRVGIGCRRLARADAANRNGTAEHPGADFTPPVAG